MNRRLRDLKLMIPDIAVCLAPASADTFCPGMRQCHHYCIHAIIASIIYEVRSCLA
jgi:hypothetical protein